MLNEDQLKLKSDIAPYQKLAAAVIEGAMKEFKYMSLRKPEMEKYKKLISQGVQDYAAAKAAGAARPQYWKRLCDRYEKTKAFVLGPTAWHNVLGLDAAFYEEAIRKIENGTDSLGEITDTSVGAEAI